MRHHANHVHHSVRAVLACCLSIAAAVPEGLRADETSSGFFRDVILGSGVHVQYWNGEGDLRVREFSVPVTFVLPMSRRLSLDLVTGSGFATLDRGTSDDLYRLTDTKVRASYILGDDAALLTAGLSTPTGKTTLDSLEQEVSNYLAQDALGFTTPALGQGMEANLGLATARQIGETVFGLGVGYLWKGAYTPRLGESDYTPGDELSLTVGLDRHLMDGDGKLTLDLVYTLYGRDEQEEEAVLQSGSKILVEAQALWRLAGLNWRLHLTERYTTESTSYETGEAETFANGNEFEAGLAAMARRSERLALGLAAGLRLYGDNDFDQGEAFVIGAGPEIRYRVGPGTFVDLSARYLRGEIDASGVSGIDVGGGIWIGL